MSLIRFSSPAFQSRFFDSFIDQPWSTDDFHRSTYPAVNVHEEEKAFTIELAAPGKTKKDFEIELDNDVLTLSSTQASEKEENNGLLKQKEFYYGAFQRKFTLPDSIDVAKIKGQYLHGILRVTLPKKKEALPQPTKRIAIE